MVREDKSPRNPDFLEHPVNIPTKSKTDIRAKIVFFFIAFLQILKINANTLTKKYNDSNKGFIRA
jgi:hypothetical protein